MKNKKTTKKTKTDRKNYRPPRIKEEAKIERGKLGPVPTPVEC
jgi:hypothetical protein